MAGGICSDHAGTVEASQTNQAKDSALVGVSLRQTTSTRDGNWLEDLLRTECLKIWENKRGLKRNWRRTGRSSIIPFKSQAHYGEQQVVALFEFLFFNWTIFFVQGNSLRGREVVYVWNSKRQCASRPTNATCELHDIFAKQNNDMLGNELNSLPNSNSGVHQKFKDGKM